MRKCDKLNMFNIKVFYARFLRIRQIRQIRQICVCLRRNLYILIYKDIAPYIKYNRTQITRPYVLYSTIKTCSQNKQSYTRDASLTIHTGSCMNTFGTCIDKKHRSFTRNFAEKRMGCLPLVSVLDKILALT